MQNLLTVAALFKKSWVEYRPRAGSLALFMLLRLALSLGWLLLWGIFFIALFFTRARVLIDYFSARFAGQGGIFPVSAFILLLIFVFLAITSSVIFYNWLTVAAWQFVLAAPSAHYGTALRTSWKKIFVYLGATVLRGLILIVAFLLLVIPGIWLSVWYFFVDILAARDGRCWPVFKTSRALVVGRWWAVAGRALLAFLIIFLPTEIINLIWQWHGQQTNNPFSTVNIILFALYVGMIVIVSLFAAPWFMLFKKILLENCETTTTLPAPAPTTLTAER